MPSPYLGKMQNILEESLDIRLQHINTTSEREQAHLRKEQCHILRDDSSEHSRRVVLDDSSLGIPLGEITNPSPSETILQCCVFQGHVMMYHRLRLKRDLETSFVDSPTEIDILRQGDVAVIEVA